MKVSIGKNDLVVVCDGAKALRFWRIAATENFRISEPGTFSSTRACGRASSAATAPVAFNNLSEAPPIAVVDVTGRCPLRLAGLQIGATRGATSSLIFRKGCALYRGQSLI